MSFVKFYRDYALCHSIKFIYDYFLSFELVFVNVFQLEATCTGIILTGARIDYNVSYFHVDSYV